MINFVIDSNLLRSLSPTARRELVQLLRREVTQLYREIADLDWNPESDVSYPLSVEEARALIRGLPDASRRTLRFIARQYDGDEGRADVHQLMEVAGHEQYDQLGQEISSITLALRSVTGHSDAWLLNWHPEDWVWDEEQKTYTRGAYFISGVAVRSLRQAFGMSVPEQA